MAERRDWLVVLSDRQALGWVLSTGRMAFPRQRAALGGQLAVGDRLFLYTTRGCFYNPSRDRGRVIGTARVLSESMVLDDPVEIAGRVFTHGCDLRVEALAVKGSGPELAAIRGRLSVFAIGDGWQMRLRRPLVALPAGDAAVLEGALECDAQPPADVLQGYLDAARPANPAYRSRWSTNVG